MATCRHAASARGSGADINAAWRLGGRSIAVAVVVTWTAACHPPRASLLDRSATESAESILAQVLAPWERIDAVGGDAGLTYDAANGMAAHVKVRVAAQRGVGFHLWRLNGETPTNELICANGVLVGIDHRGRCQVRRACNAETLAEFLSLRIGPDGFFQLATGNPFAIAHAEASLVPTHGDAASRTIRLSGGGAVQQVVVGRVGGEWHVLSSEPLAGNAGSRVAYNHYSAVTGAHASGVWHVPFSALVVPSGLEPSVVIKWTELHIGVGFAPDVFLTDGPADVPMCPGAAPMLAPAVTP